MSLRKLYISVKKKRKVISYVKTEECAISYLKNVIMTLKLELD